MESELPRKLIDIVQETEWLLRALTTVETLNLPAWCVGAGALRDAVWDVLQYGHTQSLPADIDVAYFDETDLSRQRDQQIQRQLETLQPDLPWEVTNQAGVHLWFEDHFGHPVEGLCSLEEAVASWPETATAVAVTLGRDGQMRVIAPLGLRDLFAMVVRRNPRRVSVQTYRERLARKRYQERWPRVEVVPI